MSISRRQFLAVSAAGVASLPALGNIWAQEEGKRNQPNILFLVTDDQRFDALACAGNSAIRTPHIDKLAKTGVVFTNTICQGTACVPSRASMLTASYPHNNGVYSNQCAAMHPTQWTFPRALQETGYYTAIFGKSHFQVLDEPKTKDKTDPLFLQQSRQFGFDHLFVTNGKHGAYRSWYKCPYTEYLRGKGLLEKYEEAFKEKYAPTVPGFLQPSPVEAEDAHDVFITREAANWIRSYDQEKPFFLWLNFVGPHSPLDPPEPYASMYKPEDMPPPIKEIPNNIPETIRVRSERFWQDHSVEEMQQARAYHYGMVSLIDDQVGRLIEALRENGRYENTIIVFTSDHGVNLGDHGVWGKHVHFKGTINAPLVVSWPGKLKKKKTVDRVVERQDLAPTFLEVAGADGKQRQYPFGESLMPFLTGKGNYVREEAFVEDETATTVVTNRYKYIYSPDWETPMLFDMTERPEEVHNLALENPELLNEMRDRMLNWLVRTHDHPNSSIRHTHRKVGNPA